MYMRGNNHQPDMVTETINTLRAEVAELKTEVKHLNRQAESRDRWVQGIGIAVIAPALLGLGLTSINSFSAQKANPVGISTSNAK
jgi:uncharacterized membrane protein YjjP (DUF1212 family)